MAKVIENRKGRRQIRLNTDDILNIVREYQNITINCYNYSEIRNKLENTIIYLPEDI